MDAAKMAGVPLLIAGEVFPYESHQRYFHETIRPREDSERKFIGPLGLRRKMRFLSAARCLLVPSLVAETSSLVTMEALSCGTPVVAFRQGALPSLINHGETGFLVDTMEEMSEAILKTTTISREICRKVARARFSAPAMTSRYLARYRDLISGGLPKSTTLSFAIPGAAYAS
jgi:glycosyltransferase involved in cell wall biosynthesis